MPRLTATFASLRERAASLNVRLTREEALLLVRQAGPREAQKLTRRRFLRYAQKRYEAEVEREALLAAIEEPSTHARGRHILPAIGVIGTASYAIAGTQVAGDAGMNVVGCTFVGCVSALGGGTVNSLIFGEAARQGVGWVRRPLPPWPSTMPPINLSVAISASLLTFLVWPQLTHVLVERRRSEIHDTARQADLTVAARDWLGLLSRDGISRESFLAWAYRGDPAFVRLSKVLSPELPGVPHPTPEQFFALLDANGDGVIDTAELAALIKKEYDGSTLLYALDTAALSASSVTGAAAAISRGLHPVVCAVAGVTMCFGGILRDLICRRDVKLGSQSYAAATAAGTIVYVSLREACLRGASFTLPLGVRAVLSASATVAVRVLDFQSEEPLLPPMHGRQHIHKSS